MTVSVTFARYNIASSLRSIRVTITNLVPSFSQTPVKILPIPVGLQVVGPYDAIGICKQRSPMA